jgi:uncharacterized protein involved in response to NO
VPENTVTAWPFMPGRTSSTDIVSVGAATDSPAPSAASTTRAAAPATCLLRLAMAFERGLHHGDEVVVLRVEVLVSAAARVGQAGVELALWVEEQDARDVLAVGAVAQALVVRRPGRC